MNCYILQITFYISLELFNAIVSAYVIYAAYSLSDSNNIFYAQKGKCF